MPGTPPGLRRNVESVAERWSDMGEGYGGGGKFLSQLQQVTPRHTSTLDGHFLEANLPVLEQKVCHQGRAAYFCQEEISPSYNSSSSFTAMLSVIGLVQN